MARRTKTLEEAEAELLEVVAEGKPRPNFVDPATLRAYSDYLKDWRWRMATWQRLQREYMPAHHGICGERLF